jgi:hypothetical protein
LDFWFQNIPSGNPEEQCDQIFRHFGEKNLSQAYICLRKLHLVAFLPNLQWIKKIY